MLVRVEDNDPTEPVKDAVAAEEVKAAEKSPPEVKPWAAEVIAWVVWVVPPLAPVMVSSLLVESQPKPELSDEIVLAPVKKASWPEVPLAEVVTPEEPAHDPQEGAELVVEIKH